MKFKADLRPEDALLILAAFLVLFSTAWDPYLTVVLAVASMIVWLVYKLVNLTRHHRFP
jgi:hypothetical protein